MVPGAPVPVSKFPELDDLWMLASERFDARGVHSFGAWLRDDLLRDMTLDGEAFIRRRARNVLRRRDGSLVPERGLMVPVQWQSLSSAYLPTGDMTSERPRPGNRVISGIEFDGIETRTRGDQIIARYDAAAGARAAASMEDRLLALVAGQVEKPGSRERICKRLPSAYPAALGQGVRSPKVRSEIRAEAFEGWGLARLLAALDACGYEATLTVQPKSG